METAVVYECEVRDRLVFSRGVLALLRDTELFGPMLDKAIEDLDFVIEKAERGQLHF